MTILGTPVQDAVFWMAVGLGLSMIVAGIVALIERGKDTYPYLRKEDDYYVLGPDVISTNSHPTPDTAIKWRGMWLYPERSGS